MTENKTAEQAKWERKSMVCKQQSNHRPAFTLIELLVVVVVIGILIGLVLPAVMGSLRRGQESAIQMEMSQLEAAIEAFKVKYGFYPPDFTRMPNGYLDFIPYLNRVAPNHAETTTSLVNWWDQVGRHLGPESAYVFWLSGLSRNKQYPLSDVTTGVPVPLAGYNTGSIEREVFFDFKNDRLYKPDDDDDPTTPPGSAPVLIGGPGGMYASYSQYTGECQPYAYFELKSWTIANVYPRTIATGTGNYDVTPYSNGTVFYNRDTFQFISPGMDARFSATVATTPVVFSANARERDNLTNFSDGRLETVILQ